MKPIHTRTPWAAALALALACLAPTQGRADDSSSALRPDALATTGAASLQRWHAAARDAIARHKPNQQAALRLLAYLARAQHRAAQALDATREAMNDAAWSALFDRVSAETLGGLMPAQADAWRALAASLSATLQSTVSPSDLARVQAIADQAARETLERAAHDGFDAPWAGTPPDDASAWHSQLQPPRPPHLPALGRMQPLFLASGDALRPPAPPAPGSAAFDKALAEVRTRVASGGPEALARARRWEMTSGLLAPE